MSDNGAGGGVKVTCSKCQFSMSLSEDEVVLFFHNFSCLRCGARTALPVSKETYAELRRGNDRERRPPTAVPKPPQDTMKHVR